MENNICAIVINKFETLKNYFDEKYDKKLNNIEKRLIEIEANKSKEDNVNTE